MVRARRLARDREQCVFFDCAVCLSSRFGFLLSLVDFFRRSALRVSPAETRLTVYRRLYMLRRYISIYINIQINTQNAKNVKFFTRRCSNIDDLRAKPKTSRF